MKKTFYALLLTFLPILLCGCQKTTVASDSNFDDTILGSVLPESESMTEPDFGEEVFDISWSEVRESILNRTITLSAGECVVTKKFGELGVVFLDEEKCRTLFQRFEDEPVRLPRKLLTFNSFGVSEMIGQIASEFDQERKNPHFVTYLQEEDRLIWGKEEEGREIDREITLSRILEAVSGFSGNDLDVTAATKIITPEWTNARVQDGVCLLARSEIPFISDSASGRNAKRAVELLNGTELEPGEVLSCSQIFFPFTEENGYVTSTGFLDGIIEKVVGGGVCRVVTTLYGAVLRTQLEVAERHGHSKIVSYASPGFDATVSAEEKDLKIRNNTLLPVVILANTTSDKIVVELYGEQKEEDKGYSYEFMSVVSDIVGRTSDEVIIDETLPDMAYNIVLPGEDGCKTVLYRKTIKDGIVLKTELVNKSYYLPRASIVTAGKCYRR